MLTIRPEQLEAFQPLADAAFERRVAAYIRENHADEVVILPTGEHEVKDLDNDTLLKMVRAGIGRARAYGMEWESSITSFVVIMFLIAPNFDSHPLIRHILQQGQNPPDLRIDNLWERASEETWDIVLQGYGAAAWGITGQKL